MVFLADFDGGQGVFTANALLAATGDVIAGKTMIGFGDPSLNNNGTLAFRGYYDGGEGIFLSSRLLVGTGEVIDGRTVVSVGRPFLNDNDALTFTAFFSDGSEGVVLAEDPPVVIPTLNTQGMILFSLLLAGSAFWMMDRKRIRG
jgi:hypothetical protein